MYYINIILSEKSTARWQTHYERLKTNRWQRARICSEREPLGAFVVAGAIHIQAHYALTAHPPWEYIYSYYTHTHAARWYHWRQQSSTSMFHFVFNWCWDTNTAWRTFWSDALRIVSFVSILSSIRVKLNLFVGRPTYGNSFLKWSKNSIKFGVRCPLEFAYAQVRK